MEREVIEVSPAWLVVRWTLAGMLVAAALTLWVFWIPLPRPYGAWSGAAAIGGGVLGALTVVGLRVARRPAWRWLLLAGGCLALLALAAAVLLMADPFCWRGYVAADGACAWE